MITFVVIALLVLLFCVIAATQDDAGDRWFSMCGIAMFVAIVSSLFTAGWYDRRLENHGLSITGDRIVVVATPNPYPGPALEFTPTPTATYEALPTIVPEGE